MSIKHLAGRIVEQPEQRHPGYLGISYEHWGVRVGRIPGFLYPHRPLPLWGSPEAEAAIAAAKERWAADPSIRRPPPKKSETPPDLPEDQQEDARWLPADPPEVLLRPRSFRPGLRVPGTKRRL